MKKEIKKFFNKVVTFGGVIAVSKTEMGMDYIQVLPDNPSVGQVEAFHGFGYGQLRHKLPTILRKDIYKVIAYLIKEGWSK